MRVQVVDDAQVEFTKRVLGYLGACAEQGATRSDLMQRYRLSAKKLDSLLVHLRQREGFFEKTELTKGRPSQRYTFQPAFNIRGQDGRRQCVWCYDGIPDDSTSAFCSDVCKRLGAEEQVKVKDILGEPKGNMELVRAARYLVAAHLSARGFLPHLADDPMSLVVVTTYGYHFMLRIIVGDGAGDVSATLVQGRGATIAIVLRTGRVSYYGLPDPNPPARDVVEPSAQKENRDPS